MNWKEFLKHMNEGWVLEVKTSASGLTEFRTLVKGNERKKGIPQAVKALCTANVLIDCDDYNTNPQIWRISSSGQVVARYYLK